MIKEILKVRDFQKACGDFIQDNPEGFPGEVECENMTESLNKSLWDLDKAINDGEMEDTAVHLVELVHNAFEVVNKMGMHKIFDDMFDEANKEAMSAMNIDGKIELTHPERVFSVSVKKYLEKNKDQIKMKL